MTRPERPPDLLSRVKTPSQSSGGGASSSASQRSALTRSRSSSRATTAPRAAGRVSSNSPPSRSTSATSSSPVRHARAAWSSCGSGAFQKHMMASPMNFSSVAPCCVSTPVACSK